MIRIVRFYYHFPTTYITHGQTATSETPEAILFFLILSHHEKQIGPNPQGLSNFRK